MNAVLDHAARGGAVMAFTVPGLNRNRYGTGCSDPQCRVKIYLPECRVTSV